MSRPKHNPLPETEQKKQRTKASENRLTDAGGKRVSVRLPDEATLELFERVKRELDTKTDSDTFLKLLRQYGQKKP